MSDTIAFVKASTYSYADKDAIAVAVDEAIDSLLLPDDFIKPGMTVLIKPNLVMDKNGNSNGGTECLYTQASVVRPVIDYVISKMGKTGRIIVGDAPMQECVFSNIKGYKELVEAYVRNGYNISLHDFRGLKSDVRDGIYHAVQNNFAEGVVVDLGNQSEFYNEPSEVSQKMRVSNYDPRILITHHSGKNQEYFISKEFLEADVVINMPKPKSHRKAGMTAALKNLVGINVRKEYLPHHTMGSLKEGGDEYLEKNIFHSVRSKLIDKKNIASSEGKYRKAKFYNFLTIPCSVLYRLTRSSNYDDGCWYGNNTISKTIVDLNRIAIYADKNGKICTAPQRKMLIIGDMIISGEKEGPVSPSPKAVGIIVAGTNSYAFDEKVVKLMGFDSNKIPVFKYARETTKKSILPEDVFVVYKGLDEETNLKFEATNGWKGHIERI